MVTSAGAVGVDVLPDFSRFGPQMRSGINRAVQSVDTTPAFREQGKRAGSAMADETGKAAQRSGTRGMLSVGKSLGGGFRAAVMAPLAMLGPQMAAVLGAAALVQGIKGATDAASDMNETVSASGQVFGKAAPEMQKWASSAATSLGLSNKEALEGATLFGNFFHQIGIGSSATTKMSQGFVQMSSDFASFYNADPAEVMHAFQGATRGEYDELQRFLPTIQASTVQAEALRETHKKSVKDLTDAEKATALYTLAQKGAGAAAGDFQRTAGGMANQQRIMSAQWADLQVKIGSFFLPILNKVMIFINSVVIPGLYKFGDFLSVVFTGQWSKAWTMIQQFGSNLGKWLVSTGSMIWAKLQVWGTAFVAWIGPRIVPMLQALGGLWLKMEGWIWTVALPAIVKALVGWGRAFVAWVAPYIPPLLAALWGLLQKLGGWLWGTGLPWLVAHLAVWGKAFVDWIGPRIMPMLQALANFAGKIVGWLIGTGLPWLWAKLQQWGKAFVDWIGPRIMPMLTALAGFAGKIVGWLVGTGLPWLIAHLLQWGLAFISWLLPRLPGMLLNLIKFVGGMVLWLIVKGIPLLVGAIVKVGAAFIGGFWDSIKNSDLGKKIAGFFSGLVTFLKKPINTIIGFINDNMIDKINAVLGAIGVGNIPHIPMLATGGPVGGGRRGENGGPGFRSGGRVRGPGSGTSDSIPAWLSNGEYVINAKATREFLPLLHAINNGQQAPGNAFGIGGWVGSAAGWLGNLAKSGARWVFQHALPPLQGVMDNLIPGKSLVEKIMDGWFGKLLAWGNEQGTAGQAGPAIGGGNGSNQAIGQRMAAAMGWAGQQWADLRSLWNGESGWNERAMNQSSGAYGIPQSLPASKMASAGPDWRTNPATQIRWGLDYIRSAYGSPSNAWAKWNQRSPHWYDEGGWLQPGYTMTANGTGKPEAVLTSDQWDAVRSGRGGGTQVTVIAQNVPTDAAIRRALLMDDLLYG
jgi:hypothetical protein